MINRKRLKTVLDRLYREYDFQGRVAHDPIEFPHRYQRPEDIELSGFIASCLAYGRVDLFKPVIGKVLAVMGESPADFLLSFSPKKHGPLFSGIKYRFNENEDILCLLYALHRTLKTHGSLEAAFMEHYSTDDHDTGNGLKGLVDTMLGIDTRPVYGKNIRTPGFLQFIPSPAKGSGCKRMNLFLRWMVRDRDIDFGIWKGIPKNRLVIPLDTHIARISRCLGLTKRASMDWRMAVEISDSLRELDPEDPLKYDFALCHQGISKVCSKENCGECSFSMKRSS